MNRIGHEIDAELAIGQSCQAQLRSQSNGLDPTCLVESVAMGLIDPRKKRRRGRLSTHTSHQRFVSSAS